MIIEKEQDLLALHRALYAIRFSTNIEDDEIAGSTLLADIHSRIADEIVAIERQRGESAFLNWLNGDRSAELSVARHWIKRSGRRFQNLDVLSKRQYILALFAPFKIDEKTIEDLIKIEESSPP
jgi:hypothetical protein